MLTAAQLARAREAQWKALPDICTIRTPTFSKDSVGGTTATWTTITLPCRVAGMAGSERYTADKQMVFARYVLTLPYGASLDERCEVIHGGTTYRVLFVETGRTWQTALRAEMERVA